MARHARTSATAAGLGRIGERLRAWAERTERAWTARIGSGRSGAHLAAGVAKDTSMLIAVFAAVVATFGLLFVLAGHPLRPQAPPPAIAVRPGSQADSPTAAPKAGPSSSGATPSNSGQSSATSAVALAVTPPAASATSASATATVQTAGTLGSTDAPTVPSTQEAVGSTVGSAPEGPPPSLQPPVGGQVLQGFGWAYSTIFGDWQQHTGIDLAAEAGQRILSPGAGVVAAIRQDSLWGQVVSIVLDHGYSTNISPFARVDVAIGQAVRPGTALGIAAASSAAESTLPSHVFWQLFAGTRPIDPAMG